MIASIERPDHTYDRRENGAPECGTDACDACGDCLVCYASDECVHSASGEHHWVVYLPDPKAEAKT